MRAVWEGDDDGLMLLTEDPQVISSLRQRTAQNGAKVVRLERDLAAAQAVAVADTARRLAPLGIAGDEATRAVTTVNAQLRQVDSLVAAGRIPEAYRLARSSRQTLSQAADAQRRAVGVPTELGHLSAGDELRSARRARPIHAPHAIRCGAATIFSSAATSKTSGN